MSKKGKFNIVFKRTGISISKKTVYGSRKQALKGMKGFKFVFGKTALKGVKISKLK